jgi:hypothetical protein
VVLLGERQALVSKRMLPLIYFRFLILDFQTGNIFPIYSHLKIQNLKSKMNTLGLKKPATIAAGWHKSPSLSNGLLELFY